MDRQMRSAYLPVLFSMTLTSACSVSPSHDAGGDVVITPQPPIDVVGVDGPGRDATVDAGNDSELLPSGFFPARAPAFSAGADDPLSVQVSVSGEALAENGYDYASNPAANQAVFADAWEIRFDRYLVVLDHARLNQPGPDPSMRAGLGGLVAELDGPWMVDLHQHGALEGAGGPPETAIPLGIIRTPSAGGMFDPTVRYAFSFDTVAASVNVLNVNLPESDADAASQMIAHGWTKYFSGTATYRGRVSSTSVDPTFRQYPTTVNFAFGFGDPASYINCHNPEIGQMDTASTRGIQPSVSRHVRAQITMHTDHFFWDEADVEGTPLHFDPIAARAVGFGADAGSRLSVSLDQLANDPPAALVDAFGAPVLDRSGQTMGISDNSPPPAYSVHSAGASIHDLRDFVVYNARGQGHLNSDGLCFVQPTATISY